MLVVDTNTNRWYDHATDQSGDIIDLAALKMNPNLYTDPRDFILKYMNEYEQSKELSAMARRPQEPIVISLDIRKVKLTDFMKALVRNTRWRLTVISVFTMLPTMTNSVRQW